MRHTDYVYNSNQVVNVRYTNHRGERRWRKVVPLPLPLHFGHTEYHPEPQWLMHVYDVDKQARRTLAVRDICGWEPAVIVHSAEQGA